MKKNGYSLIEILVVLTVFSLLAVLSTQAILLTLRSARKSEASIEVRENLESALSVMERQLRSAKSINTTTSTSTRINYQDYLGASSYFECLLTGVGYIASGSGTIRLTSSDIDLSACSFTFPSGTTPSVSISLTAANATTTGVESANATVNTKVFLRQ